MHHPLQCIIWKDASSTTSTLIAAQTKKKSWGKIWRKTKESFIMRQAVADTIFSRIMGIISAKDVWSTLQEDS